MSGTGYLTYRNVTRRRVDHVFTHFLKPEFPMSSDPSKNPGWQSPLDPRDSLPPIEPPSMKFIVQLFVIPGVIVAAIVLVWLVIDRLTAAGNNPRDYVAALKRNSETRWQASINLASAMNGTRNTEIRSDPNFAKELSQLLSDELIVETENNESITLREYLCKTLGEFWVDEPLPALVKAAGLQRNNAEIPVRRAAIQSLGLLAENVRTHQQHELKHPDLIPTLLAVSNLESNILRSEGAYALALVGGDEAITRLEAMVHDPYPDARYNASAGLARHGNDQGRDVLLEMLNPAEHAGIDLELEKGLKEHKQILMIDAALRSVTFLLEKNPQLDIAPYLATQDKLLATLNGRPKDEVKHIFAQLRERSEKGKSLGDKP